MDFEGIILDGKWVVCPKWRIETIRDVKIPIPIKKDTKGWLVLIKDGEGNAVQE